MQICITHKHTAVCSTVVAYKKPVCTQRDVSPRCSAHEEAQTGAAHSYAHYSGQHSEQQILGETHTDTLTLFFTLCVNEHMMFKVSNNK